MTSTEVLSPPPPTAVEHATSRKHGMELPLQLPFCDAALVVPRTGDAGSFAPGGWRVDSGKVSTQPASCLLVWLCDQAVFLQPAHVPGCFTVLARPLCGCARACFHPHLAARQEPN